MAKAEKKKKTEAQIKAEKKQQEALDKLAAFTKKNAKDLGVSVTSDLVSQREGRNGAIPTASLCADLIMGGGIPRHRLVVVSGMEGTCKTTIMQGAIANQLALGGMVHYGDFEGAADGTWIKNSTGVDLSDYEGGKDKRQTFYPLFDFQNAEDYFRYINRLLEETVNLGLQDLPGVTHLFTGDSIAAMIPEDLVEDDDKGSKPYVALLMAKWLPTIRSRLKRANSSMILINQIRQKIRLKNPYENPDYEPGGNTPRFMADIRLRAEVIQPKHINGNKHFLIHEKNATPRAGGVWHEVNPDGSTDQYVYRKIRTLKNRVFPPFKETYVRICISRQGGEGTGIDPVFDVLHFFEEIGELRWHGPNELDLKGQVFTYQDLKQEILTKPDLRQEADDLMNSNGAYEKYHERFGKAGKDIGKPTSEDGDEHDEPEKEEA